MIVTSDHWTSSNFLRAFQRLALPVTTANPSLVRKWQPDQVWAGFWASVQDFCRNDRRCSELIEIVMAKSENTEDGRAKLQAFVDREIPGYRLIYEADILEVLNSILERMGSTERVMGFRYGKDGKGALPDRYYQLLFKNRFLVIGNHHDILSHLILLTCPLIKQSTERLVSHFSDALEVHHQLQRNNAAQAGAHDRSIAAISRILRLYTLAWNLLQEKVYVRTQDDQGAPILNLLGAFNLVYNPIFSSDLGPDNLRTVSGALGFFNARPDSCILMPPPTLAEIADFMPGAKENADIQLALKAYRELWLSTGANESEAEARDLAQRFEAAIEKSILLRSWTPISARRRWVLLSRQLMADPKLSLFCQKEMLMSFSNRLVDLAIAMFEHGRSHANR